MPAVADLPVPRSATGLPQDPASDIDDQTVLFGEVDEVVGGNQTTGGVLPAHERLQAHHLARGEGDGGLVVEDELALLDGPAHITLELEAGHGRGVHGGVEEAVAALPLALGSVHGGVGVAQQLVGGLAIALGEADPQAGVNEDLLAREEERWGQDVDDALRQAIGSFGFFQVLEQDGELVAAQTSRGVAGSQAALQADRHRDEQLVADRVTQAVVHGLEAVEVHHHDRDRGGVPFLATHGVVHTVGEQRPVGQVRQRVVEGLMTQLRLEGVAVGHVLHGDEDCIMRIERKLMGPHLDVDDAPVLQAMPPGALVECVPFAPHLGQETGHIFGRTDVGDASIEELLPCVAVVADGRLVHLEELEGIDVIDPHRLGVVGEELAEARLAHAQLRIRCLLSGGLRSQQLDHEGHA